MLDDEIKELVSQTTFCDTQVDEGDSGRVARQVMRIRKLGCEVELKFLVVLDDLIA